MARSAFAEAKSMLDKLRSGASSLVDKYKDPIKDIYNKLPQVGRNPYTESFQSRVRTQGPVNAAIGKAAEVGAFGPLPKLASDVTHAFPKTTMPAAHFVAGGTLLPIERAVLGRKLPQQETYKPYRIAGGIATSLLTGGPKQVLSHGIMGAGLGSLSKAAANIYNKRPITEGMLSSAKESGAYGAATSQTFQLTGNIVNEFAKTVPFLKPLTDEAIQKGLPTAQMTLTQALKKLGDTGLKRIFKAALIETPVEALVYGFKEQGDKQKLLDSIAQQAKENFVYNVGFAGLNTAWDSRVVAPIVKRSLDQAIQQYKALPATVKQSGHFDPFAKVGSDNALRDLITRRNQLLKRYETAPLAEKEAISRELSVVNMNIDDQANRAGMPGFRYGNKMYYKGGEAAGKDTKGSLYDISEKAKKVIGTTNRADEAGYITQDGKMLDFTGRHYASGYEGGKPKAGQPDYLAGQRNVDHREISQIFDESGGIGGTDAMLQFEKAGNIRVSPSSGDLNMSINLDQKITPQQIQTLKNMQKQLGGKIYYDIYEAGGRNSPIASGETNSIDAIMKQFKKLQPNVAQLPKSEVSTQTGQELPSSKQKVQLSQEQTIKDTSQVFQESQSSQPPSSVKQPLQKQGVQSGRVSRPDDMRVVKPRKKVPSQGIISQGNQPPSEPPPKSIASEDNKYAFNINKNRLNLTQEEKVVLDKTVAQIKPQLERAKGKPLTQDEILEAAVWSDVLRETTSRAETKDFTASLLRTRQRLAQGVKEGGVSKQFIDDLRVVSSHATDIARKLKSFDTPADPVGDPNIKEKLIKNLMDLGHKTDELVKEGEGVDWNNMKEVTDFYRKFKKADFSEVVNEYRYINILSSPQTHIVNTFSNIVQTAGLNPATRLVSGTTDWIGASLTGKQRNAYVAEVPAYYKGMLNSIGDAVQGARDVMKGEKMIGRPDVKYLPTGSNLTKPFKFVLNALEASDVFFRTLVKGGELEALALRMAKQGKQIDFEKIETEADGKAAYWIFRKALDPSNKTGQGQLLSYIDRMTSSIYQFREVPGVRWFIPFVQTPMNILKQGIEFSPAGVLTMKGAANKNEQFAKAIIGSTVMAGAAYLSQVGDSTWAAPTSEKDKEAFYGAGKKPYSIKLGDKWVSYSRLGPLAYPMAIATAWKYYNEQQPKAMTDEGIVKFGKTLGSLVGFFSDQSYMQGLGDLVDIARGDQQAWKRFTTNVPRQVIPMTSLLSWTARIIDPVYRKPTKDDFIKGSIETIKTGIPGLSKQVEPYTDPLGQPSKREMPVLNAFSPANISSSTKLAGYERTRNKIKQIDNYNDKIKEQLRENKIPDMKNPKNQSAVADILYSKYKSLPKEQKMVFLKDMQATGIITSEVGQMMASFNQAEKIGLTRDDLLMARIEPGITRAMFIRQRYQDKRTTDSQNRYTIALLKFGLLDEQTMSELKRIYGNGQ